MYFHITTHSDYTTFQQLKKHLEQKLFTPHANKLAQQLIPFGETNYNCWYVKKMCYLNKAMTYEHEMQFSEETLFQKVKNFQLWEHRRFLLEDKNDMQEYTKEYMLIDKILEIQPKNYHAWSHRVWVLGKVRNYNQELQFTFKLLQQDLFNNSVWAHRIHLVKKIVEAIDGQENKENAVDVEVTTCLKMIQKHMNNHAAWNYLRGIFPAVRLVTMSSVNAHTFVLPVGQTTYKHVVAFTREKLAEIQELFTTENFIPKNYQLESQIELLTTLATLLSHDQLTREFAKNVFFVVMIELLITGGKGTAETVLLEVGCNKFGMMVYKV